MVQLKEMPQRFEGSCRVEYETRSRLLFDMIQLKTRLALGVSNRPGEIPKIFENSPLKPLNGQPNLGQC